ncbi:hypothetical protein L208DRAFT_1392459 [Tricholoma matsutake]|nr:hypothetical protein L208DRAFT_1392459 [Tricholoma matsutake 945]
MHSCPPKLSADTLTGIVPQHQPIMNLTYLSTAFIIALAAGVSATGTDNLLSCTCTWTADPTSLNPRITTLKVVETKICSSNTVLPRNSICRDCCKTGGPSGHASKSQRMLRYWKTPNMWSISSRGVLTQQSRNKDSSSKFSIY